MKSRMSVARCCCPTEEISGECYWCRQAEPITSIQCHTRGIEGNWPLHVNGVFVCTRDPSRDSQLVGYEEVCVWNIFVDVSGWPGTAPGGIIENAVYYYFAAEISTSFSSIDEGARIRVKGNWRDANGTVVHREHFWQGQWSSILERSDSGYSLGYTFDCREINGVTNFIGGLWAFGGFNNDKAYVGYTLP